MVVILISKMEACYPQTLVESEELGSVELVVLMYCINLFVNTFNGRGMNCWRTLSIIRRQRS